MDRKAIIEKALDKNELYELEYLSEIDDDILLDLFRKYLKLNNYYKCALLTNELCDYPVGSGEKEYDTIVRSEEIIQKLLFTKIEYLVTKKDIQNIKDIITAWERIEILDSMDNSIRYAVELLLDQEYIELIIELTSFLIKSTEFDLSYINSQLLKSFELSLLKNNILYNRLFEIMLSVQKQHDFYFRHSFDKKFIKLLINNQKKTLITKYINILLDNKSDLNFIDLNNYIFKLSQTFAIILLNFYINKYPKHYLIYVAQFKNYSYKRKKKEIQDLSERIINSKYSVKFVNNVEQYFIISKISISKAKILINDMYVNGIINIYKKNNLISKLLLSHIDSIKSESPILNLINKFESMFTQLKNEIVPKSEINQRIIKKCIQINMTMSEKTTDKKNDDIRTILSHTDFIISSQGKHSRNSNSFENQKKEKIVSINSKEIKRRNCFIEIGNEISKIKTNSITKVYIDDIISIFENIRIISDLFETKKREIAKHKAEMDKMEEDKNIRLNERNKIMANISHTVKNMLSSVIDPLEKIKETGEAKPVVVDNAIRGANLIRSLVNAMNLSFKGSIEDFIYDVQNNTYENSSSVDEMFIDSLKQAISTTFDGKYFKKFVDNYYPTKAIFLEAKQKWSDISQFNDIEKILSFMDKYLMKTTLDISKAKEFVIGDDKGSALKLLILIQEIILNAVKYSSFVSKDLRNLHIKFNADNKNISISVSNVFKPNVQFKTSGLGNEIIKNFSKLLQTKPIINTENNLYTVEIRFKNLWRSNE